MSEVLLFCMPFIFNLELGMHLVSEIYQLVVGEVASFCRDLVTDVLAHFYGESLFSFGIFVFCHFMK